MKVPTPSPPSSWSPSATPEASSSRPRNTCPCCGKSATVTRCSSFSTRSSPAWGAPARCSPQIPSGSFPISFAWERGCRAGTRHCRRCSAAGISPIPSGEIRPPIPASSPVIPSREIPFPVWPAWRLCRRSWNGISVATPGVWELTSGADWRDSAATASSATFEDGDSSSVWSSSGIRGPRNPSPTGSPSASASASGPWNMAC